MSVKFPALYEKGEKHYVTMFLSEPVEDRATSYDYKYLTATHTQTGNLNLIWKMSDEKYIHSKLVDADTLVIYKTLFDDSRMLAKPLKKFIEEFNLV